MTDTKALRELLTKAVARGMELPAYESKDVTEYTPSEDGLVTEAINALPALLDEVEALRAEVADLRMAPGGLDKWQGVISAYVGEAREAAFRDGAEKMREAAANACKTACDCNVQACWSGREVAADAIRALPLPEDNK